MLQVIIQFATYDARSQWIDSSEGQVRRLYQREPWLLAVVSEAVASRLAHQPGVKVVPDGQLAPM